jgi:hypothetical protein
MAYLIVFLVILAFLSIAGGHDVRQPRKQTHDMLINKCSVVWDGFFFFFYRWLVYLVKKYSDSLKMDGSFGIHLIQTVLIRKQKNPFQTPVSWFMGYILILFSDLGVGLLSDYFVWSSVTKLAIHFSSIQRILRTSFFSFFFITSF